MLSKRCLQITARGLHLHRNTQYACFYVQRMSAWMRGLSYFPWELRSSDCCVQTCKKKKNYTRSRISFSLSHFVTQTWCFYESKLAPFSVFIFTFFCYSAGFIQMFVTMISHVAHSVRESKHTRILVFNHFITFPSPYLRPAPRTFAWRSGCWS